MKPNHIYHGEALTTLKTLPDAQIDMCMTSPPYWALRDYGVAGQLGLEPDFNEYIKKLCDIFDEAKRVLKPEGTCWVNLGDTYWGGGNAQGHDEDTLNAGSSTIKRGMVQNPVARGNQYQNKSLIQIPHRFAIEMCNRGWTLRNTIIWHKNNCMPSSVDDRFTVDFEYLFFFSKQQKYYFEQQFEKHLTQEQRPAGVVRNRTHAYDSKFNNNPEAYNSPRARCYREGYNAESHFYNPLGRNKRCVWTINPKPFKEAHFATYPEELCETPIKAGCPIGGIVLDPFFGAGTTGLVALKQQKRFVGIELNEEYITIAKKRLLPWLEQERLIEVAHP